MTAWRHPRLGTIELLPPSRRPKKVWAHFYSVAEHWERLCGLDINPMRETTELIVGRRREDCDDIGWLDGTTRWSEARTQMVRDHDVAYGPAYQAEMTSSETLWTQEMDASFRHKALTPRSVFIVVELNQPSWVVTAFRPHPQTWRVDWDEADLRRHAEWYFQRDTGMNLENLRPTVATNLRRSSGAVPGTARDLWWLASAVGYGRLLSRHAEVRAALSAGEQVLGAVREEVIAALRSSLDWEGCSRRLAAALTDVRSEELEAVLATSEELLAVAGTIGAELRAESFCADAEALIVWLPSEWAHLIEHAASRRDTFSDSESLVVRLWAAVEDAAIGAALREKEAAVRPAARLVDALISDRPGLVRRAQSFARGTWSAVAGWVRDTLDAVTITRPAPALASAQSEAAWELHGHAAKDAPQHRVFIVDDDYPNGVEVTHRINSDGKLWQFERSDERVWMIVVASKTVLPGTTLESLLDDAAHLEDAVIDARELQPSQTTKSTT